MKNDFSDRLEQKLKKPKKIIIIKIMDIVLV